VIDESRIPPMLCPDCSTLLDAQARCRSCNADAQRALDICAYQLVLAREYGTMNGIGVLREMAAKYPEIGAYRGAVEAIERAERRYADFWASMTAAS
jgi:hypothetical protein